MMDLMANKTIGISDDLQQYVVELGVREPDVLARLRAETAALPQHRMQVAPEQGAFLALLVELIGARRCLEVGTFTGYSSTAVALALPEDGTLVCCDVSREWTDVARRYWADAGVADKIDLRLAPAVETLDGLLGAGEEATYDFAFVDADKTGYAAYYERLLRLVRPGGLIAIDNTLWGGRVVDPEVDDADTTAIRAFNRRLADDDRVSLSLLPLADGVTLARRR
jgi:caffeoyl-CoA O-methyltransferase